MNDIKLIIFDMDGLMTDTEKVSLKSWEICLYERKLESDTDFLISLMGTTKYYIYKKFNEKYKYINLDYEKDFEPDFLRKRAEIIFSTEPKKLIKKGLLELIEFSKKNGIKIAVASSSFKQDVIKLLKYINVYDLFDFIICGDEIKNSKPNPEIFNKVIEKTNISKENTIILEDSQNGLIAGYNANIKTIFIKDIVTPSDDVLQNVWKKADSLLNVIDIINEK